MSTTDLEAQVTSICAKALNRSRLGPDDDLMEAGMDSLVAVEIVTRLELSFGADVVDVIFETPTVNHLCAAVRRALREGSARPVTPPEPGPATTGSSLPAATTLLGLVTEAAVRYGTRPYLLPVEPESRVVTFADVLTFTRGCARLLEERGVPEGARVAMVAHNSSLAALLFLGVIASGRVLVPLNPKAGAAELETLLTHCGPALVLGREATAAKLRERPEWVGTDDEESLLTDLLARGEAHGNRPLPSRAGTADAEIVYTSGSTGTPKGVVLSHRALLSGSRSLARWAEADSEDVFLNVDPLFHAGGQVFPTLTPLWCGGRTVCVRSEAAMARFWAYVDRYDPTWTLVVNAYLAHLVERPERPARNSLKGVLAGGSPLAVELIHRFEATFGLPVHQVYGMTEMASITTVEPRGRESGERRSAGLPLDCSRVRVVGQDGRDVAPGESGEVLLTGENMFTRYEDAPGLTERRLDDGWIRTGDLGRLDERGELSIVDRLDSMVIVNGENLYPSEIEGVVPHLGGVQDAVLVTLPHPVTGVELVLVYTLLPGAGADADGWRATLLKHVSTFKVPRRFVPVGDLGLDAFPRTPLGKIVRPEVQRLATEHLS
ncbi:AMP-binding protein [Streptosporangium saharense]|uniref:Acyl-CoA synthetase (AMP-forming)/AMP-acid ligase II/acyl carrier protein n=1 Tax=Streptosporangium saharense TaxID=1706840 RepID=A0A7W7QLG2_9ACTN|nr:AMP-binding protein [Streptosporangium saharense]MBB4915653.1 acyl-CoA synthetase (AMP-forming)/AMP-acid ligase II/acyl carrier protein [Streptosporangium saharense]